MSVSESDISVFLQTSFSNPIVSCSILPPKTMTFYLQLLLLIASVLTSEIRSGMIPSFEVQDSGVSVSLRGLSVVSSEVAWASGENGTVIRTVDAGQSWQQLPKIKRNFLSSFSLLTINYLNGFQLC